MNTNSTSTRRATLRITAACVAALALGGRIAPAATGTYGGIVTRITGTSSVIRDLSWSSFVSSWQTRNGSGQRLVDIERYVDASGNVLFAGIFRPGTDGYYLWAGADAAGFRSVYDQQAAAGLRLVDLESYVDGGVLRYIGVWRSGSSSHDVILDATRSTFQSYTTSMYNAGLRLAGLDVAVVNDQARYSAYYRTGSGSQTAHLDLTWCQLAKEWNDGVRLGRGFVDVDAYVLQGKRLYAAVQRYGGSDQELVAPGLASSLATRTQIHAAEGRQMVRLVHDDLAEEQPPVGFAEALLPYEQGAVGYAFAYDDGGVLKMQGGYGYARATWEAQNAATPMTAKTRLHVASMSKTITAVAIMKLVQDGSLSLDAPFFPIVKSRMGNPTPAAGVAQITIRQLLRHESGFPGSWNCGPEAWASMKSLVSQPLSTPQYSNANFSMLRCVLEAVTVADYETWVKQNVLAPMGATLASCAPTTTAMPLYYLDDAFTSRRPGAVWPNYAKEAGAYGWYVSAEEMMKFLRGIENNTVLTAQSKATMLDNQFGNWQDKTARGAMNCHNGGWDINWGAFEGFAGLGPKKSRFVVLVNTRVFTQDPVVCIKQGYARFAPPLSAARTSAQSSTFGTALASYAVDGKLDASFLPDGAYGNATVTHTNYDAQAFWKVDLGASRKIAAVDVWNRTDAAPERLANFCVEFSTDGATWFTTATSCRTGGVDRVASFDDQNVTARHVRVRLNGTNYLSLAEVRVWAH